jgi:hypothetical protein
MEDDRDRDVLPAAGEGITYTLRFVFHMTSSCRSKSAIAVFEEFA